MRDGRRTWDAVYAGVSVWVKAAVRKPWKSGVSTWDGQMTVVLMSVPHACRYVSV
jgi:hypothetical protein